MSHQLTHLCWRGRAPGASRDEQGVVARLPKAQQLQQYARVLLPSASAPHLQALQQKGDGSSQEGGRLRCCRPAKSTLPPTPTPTRHTA